MSTSGKFVWFEYMGSDTQKAKGFFGELFGWTSQPVPLPEGTYEMIASGGRTIGGYAPGGEPAWRSFLRVADAAAAATQAVSLGGTIVQRATKVGDLGTKALITDPHGATIALWQPAKPEDVPPPTVGTFYWTELASSDPAASVAFYSALGGFTEQQVEMPDGLYHVLQVGDDPRAGIMAKMMPEHPHAWLPYIQVESADRIAAQAAKLGGTVAIPPMDVPNVGRFALLVDTQGASIGVMQP